MEAFRRSAWNLLIVYLQRITGISRICLHTESTECTEDFYQRDYTDYTDFPRDTRDTWRDYLTRRRKGREDFVINVITRNTLFLDRRIL